MTLTEQIKARRKQLGLQQKEMKLRIGMEQQQYQRVESGCNVTLKNLILIAEGLEAELILVPEEHLRHVRQLIQENMDIPENQTTYDPWPDLLGED